MRSVAPITKIQPHFKITKNAKNLCKIPNMSAKKFWNFVFCHLNLVRAMYQLSFKVLVRSVASKTKIRPHFKIRVKSRPGDRTSQAGARTPILKTIHIDPCQESTHRRCQTISRQLSQYAEEAPTSAFSLLKAYNRAVTLKNILRQYHKWALRPFSHLKLGHLSTKIFTEQQLTKILLNEEEAQVGTFSEYCENY